MLTVACYKLFVKSVLLVSMLFSYLQLLDTTLVTRINRLDNVNG